MKSKVNILQNEFLVSDAEKVAECIVNNQDVAGDTIQEIYELVKANIVAQLSRQKSKIFIMN